MIAKNQVKADLRKIRSKSFIQAWGKDLLGNLIVGHKYPATCGRVGTKKVQAG